MSVTIIYDVIKKARIIVIWLLGVTTADVILVGIALIDKTLRDVTLGGIISVFIS